MIFRRWETIAGFALLYFVAGNCYPIAVDRGREQGPLRESEEIARALEGALNFFARRPEEVTDDVVLGVLIASANLRWIRERLRSRPSADSRTEERLDRLLRKCRRVVRVAPSPPRHLALLDGNLWRNAAGNLKAGLAEGRHPTELSLPEFDSCRSIDEYMMRGTPEDSDFCIDQLLSSACQVSEYCWLSEIGRGSHSGYKTSHRLLYFQVASQLKCDEANPKKFSGIGKRKDELCRRMFLEASALFGKPSVSATRDLFMEQIALCGLEGHEEFAAAAWRRRLGSWQAVDGCFGLDAVPGRKVYLEKEKELVHRVSKSIPMANEDALPLSPLQRLRMAEVTSCDLSATYFLAVGSSDKKVRILQWKTGLGFVDVCYSPLGFHKYAVTSVRFSPRGTILASASLDGTAVLIDVFKGTKIFTAVQEKTSNIRFCEFAFDCTKLMTGADDGTLCFWDLVRRRQIRHCRLHEDQHSLRGLAASPDSEFLLSVDSGNSLKVWFLGDVLRDRPRCFSLKKGIHDDVLGCEFSPVKTVSGGLSLKLEYRAATCGADGLAKIWEISIRRRENAEAKVDDFACDLKLLHVLKNEGDILGVRFNPGGNYIVGTGLNNVAKLWEVRTGICLGTLQGHGRYVTSAVFSKDSLLLVTGSVDKTLIVWTLSKNLSLHSQLLTPCNASSHFTNVDAENYLAGKGPTDRENQCSEFAVFQKVTFSSVVNGVRFRGGDDDLAVAGGQGNVEIWKKQTDKRKYERREALREHEWSVNHLDSSPCGNKIISCSAEGTMMLWDLNTNLAYKMKSSSCTSTLRICKFSPDSRFIVAAGDDQKVCLWDANNLEFLKTLQEHENAVTAVAYTPDGKFLVTASGSEITLQDLQQNKFAAKISNAHDLGVLCCDVSPASVPENEGTHDNINSNRCFREGSGKYLLATGGNDSLVKLWQVSAAEIFTPNALSGHGGTINCVKFSSAKPFTLASCSSDTTVRIWDTKSKHCIHVLNYHKSAVTSCSFSKDSTLLATGSLDKSVFVLRLITRPCHEPKEPDQNSNKLLENWSPSDVASWFLDIGRPEIAAKIQGKRFGGRELLSITDDSIADLFDLRSERERDELRVAFLKLKKFLSFPLDIPCKGRTIPHKFLCPITHQIMRDPVICTDGYTYDRASITEWFLSGKLISPITKEFLTTTKLLPYSSLKINIHKFLHEGE